MSVFSGVGVEGVPVGDGFAEVKVVHGGDMFDDAEDVTEGPIQYMMNSASRFRPEYGETLSSADVRYLRFDRELMIARDGSWNAEQLTKELKELLLDNQFTDANHFFFSAAFGEGQEGVQDIHWIGVEVVRGKERERKGTAPPRMILYDPGTCAASARPTWFGSKPIQYGILMPILSDGDVREAFSWGDVPGGTWGIFGDRDSALEAARLSSLDPDRLRAEHGPSAGTDLVSIIPALGASFFGPKKSACQADTSDYFCQSWVLFLFDRRASGKTLKQIEDLVDALGKKDELRRAIVEFVKKALLSDVARRYWSDKSIPRAVGKKKTKGVDFYEWLVYAANAEGFGSTESKKACDYVVS